MYLLFPVCLNHQERAIMVVLKKFCMVLFVKLETVVAFVMGKRETGKQLLFFFISV